MDGDERNQTPRVEGYKRPLEWRRCAGAPNPAAVSLVRSCRLGRSMQDHWVSWLAQRAAVADARRIPEAHLSATCSQRVAGSVGRSSGGGGASSPGQRRASELPLRGPRGAADIPAQLKIWSWPTPWACVGDSSCCPFWEKAIASSALQPRKRRKARPGIVRCGCVVSPGPRAALLLAAGPRAAWWRAACLSTTGREACRLGALQRLGAIANGRRSRSRRIGPRAFSRPVRHHAIQSKNCRNLRMLYMCARGCYSVLACTRPLSEG